MSEEWTSVDGAPWRWVVVGPMVYIERYGAGHWLTESRVLVKDIDAAADALERLRDSVALQRCRDDWNDRPPLTMEAAALMAGLG